MSRWSVNIPPRTRDAFLLAHPICWICGHPGADQIDHAIPTSKAPWLAMEPSNWRSAHGVRGCPLCPVTISSDRRRHGKTRKCNQSRQAKLSLPTTRTSRTW